MQVFQSGVWWRKIANRKANVQLHGRDKLGIREVVLSDNTGVNKGIDARARCQFKAILAQFLVRHQFDWIVRFWHDAILPPRAADRGKILSFKVNQCRSLLIHAAGPYH